MINKTLYGLKLEHKLRPRQEEAIPLIQNDDDFITVLPTGYGKTIIGIIGIAKALSQNKRAVLLSPLKVLTAEQTNLLKHYFPKKTIILDDGDNRKDSEQYGEWDIAILTYERFNSLLNKIKTRKTFSNLGLILIDEVHNFGNSSRGATLESSIIKIRILFPKVKIIGLSATIDNSKQFSTWLNTKLILAEKSERPVPLKVRVVSYRENYNAKLDLLVRVDMVKALQKRHPGKTMLIFTTSRARTKQVIEALAGVKYIGLTEALYNHKMGWHNAGMDKAEKNQVERMFREGKIKIIACTPTLAMGVNLPADICIMFDMYQWSYLTGRSIIEKDRFEQTTGRAGRPGLSKVGYAYVFVPYKDKDKIIEYIKTPLNVESRLKASLKEKVLEWIVAEIVDDSNKLELLMEYFVDKSISTEYLKEVIEWLIKNYFIRVIDNKFIPTFKGRMTSLLMISPETTLHWERVLYNKGELSNAELFCLIASAPEYANIVVPYSHDTKKIGYAETFINARDEVLKHFRSYNEEYNIWSDFTGNIYKIFALTYNKELMNKFKIEDKEFAMSYGDKYVVKNASMRYLNAASILCQKWKDQITELIVGAQHSIISGGIIELSKLKGVGDIRLQNLLSNGINSIEKLLSTSNSKLSAILKLKEDSIVKLKNNTVMFL